MAEARRRSPTHPHDGGEDERLTPQEEADVLEGWKDYKAGRGKVIRTPKELEEHRAKLKREALEE